MVAIVRQPYRLHKENIIKLISAKILLLLSIICIYLYYDLTITLWIPLFKQMFNFHCSFFIFLIKSQDTGENWLWLISSSLWCFCYCNILQHRISCTDITWTCVLELLTLLNQANSPDRVCRTCRKSWKLENWWHYCVSNVCLRVCTHVWPHQSHKTSEFTYFSSIITVQNPIFYHEIRHIRSREAPRPAA